MFETSLTVVGKIVSNIDQKDTSSGRFCSFRLMANERRFNRDTQDWADGDKLFLTVKCWRKLAENVCASLFKGDSVVASGRLYVREYTANNGEARSVLELDARAIGPNLLACMARLDRPIRLDVASEQEITLSAEAA